MCGAPSTPEQTGIQNIPEPPPIVESATQIGRSREVQENAQGPQGILSTFDLRLPPSQQLLGGN